MRGVISYSLCNPTALTDLVSIMLLSERKVEGEMSSLTFSLQALLQRHETYVADAEADRSRMLAEMERLERDKQEMQSVNARIVEENRHLLEQLEGLNNAVATSDGEIRNLSDRLQQTQLEMRALAASAARAAELELQLNAMEAEQMELQQLLLMTQEDEKSAVQRWKKAETTLRDLQDQLDRLEYDARVEREEHAQIIERMERRRAVERELDGAAGRLKGAAAASAVLDRNRNGNTTPVVSKFVRDILQDNANLQMGIVELRELLESSNQEVENLREQVLQHHQPLDLNSESEQQQPHQNVSRLDQELGSKEPRPVSQEFHVHHHYHSPSSSVSSKKEKQPIRRPRKRRPALMSSGMHSPRSPSYHRAHPSSSSTSTIMSQTSVSIPPSSQRYSVHPNGVSSLASSPISAYQPSSIFDIVDQSELSRPSSPESTSAALSSPMRPFWKNRMSDASGRSFSMPIGGFQHSDFDAAENDRNDSLDNIYDNTDDLNEEQQQQQQPLAKNTASEEIWLPPAIPEEQEEPAVDVFENIDDKHQDDLPLQATETEDAPGPSVIDNSFDPLQQYRPGTLRKSASHESLLSVSGMDIHTLRERPSQLLTGFQSRYFLRRPPQRIVSAGTEISSTPPVISTTSVTADKISIVATGGQTSSHSLLASVAAKSIPQLHSSANSDAASSKSGTATDAEPHTFDSNAATTNPIPIQDTKPANIRRRVGGWVMGKWGIAPAPASAASSYSTSIVDILPQHQNQDHQSAHRLLHPDSADGASIISSDSAVTITTTSDTTTTSQTRNTRNISNSNRRNKSVTRGFGINQTGPIPGFIPSVALPAKNVSIHAAVLDRQLLDESLKE